MSGQLTIGDVFRFLYCTKCKAKRYHTIVSIPGNRWFCNRCKTIY